MKNDAGAINCRENIRRVLYLGVSLFFILELSSLSFSARADLKSWTLTPEIVTVGSVSDRVLWNLRPGLGFSWQSTLLESDSISLHFEGKARVDTQTKFVSTDEKYDYKIDKSYVQIQGSRTSFSLGLQKYTWGDSAFFDGVDVLNPRDLTEPLYTDDNQAKISVPSANLQYLGDNTVFQTVLNLKTLRSPLEDQFENIPVRRPAERAWLHDLEWGCKAGGLLKNGLDINGYLISHIERVPQFYFSQFELRVNEPRVFSLGLTATQSVGDFVFRSEFALHSNRALPDQGALRSSTADQSVFHATLDLTSFKNLLTTFEFWGEHWFADSTPRFKPNSSLLGVRTQKPFWNGRFEPSAGYLFSSEFSESWAFTKMQLRLYSSLQVSLEAHWAETSTGRVLARRGLKNLIRSAISFQF